MLLERKSEYIANYYIYYLLGAYYVLGSVPRILPALSNLIFSEPYEKGASHYPGSYWDLEKFNHVSEIIQPLEFCYTQLQSTSIAKTGVEMVVFFLLLVFKIVVKYV